jgi:hypothetical protein
MKAQKQTMRKRNLQRNHYAHPKIATESNEAWR